MSVSTSRYHSGSRSLALAMGVGAYSSTNANGVSIQIPLCASSGTVNLAGYTFSAYMWISVTNGSWPQIYNMASPSVQYADGTASSTWYQGLNAGQWIQVTGPTNASSTQVRYLVIPLGFTTDAADPNNAGFAGTIYIDDVQLLPP